MGQGLQVLWSSIGYIGRGKWRQGSGLRLEVVKPRQSTSRMRLGRARS